MKFLNPETSELISEYQLGEYNLMVGMETPFVALNVIAKHDGKTVDNNFNTGSECKVKRNVLDNIGHRYNKTGEVQFLGAPWISPSIEPGENTPNNDEIDLWFVAAGAYAKPFCNYIKKTGSIGIDIGSSIDTWLGEYDSRKYLRSLKIEKG